MTNNDTTKISHDIKISKNAPLVPQGASLGKESMIYSYSNDILEIAAFVEISDAARTFYMYMTTIILDETHKALDTGAYNFNEKSRRFHFNIREFLAFIKKAGKKNYTFQEIQTASEELVGKPLTFVNEDSTVFETIAFFSKIHVDSITGDCFFDVESSLLAHYVPELSERKEQHLISIIESFKFSNSYADALYRLINGYIQTVDLIQDYSIPILVLKRKMGLTQEHSYWNNKYFIPRILDKALELINRGSDIHMDYEIVKFDKMNRIKDIKFIEIKRRNNIKVQTVRNTSNEQFNVVNDNAIKTVSVKEKINLSDTLNEPLLKDFNETELIIAKIFAACKKEGMTSEQAIQISEKYKETYTTFKALNDMFQTSLKYGMKKETDRYDFLMKPEINV